MISESIVEFLTIILRDEVEVSGRESEVSDMTVGHVQKRIAWNKQLSYIRHKPRRQV